MSIRSVIAISLTVIGIVAGLGLVLIGLGLAFPPDRDPRDVSIGQHVAESYAWPVTIVGAAILTLSVVAGVVLRRARRARRSASSPQ